MIFSFLGRLFGGRSGPAPLLTIDVTLGNRTLTSIGRSLGLGGGELRVLDANGNLVGGPWVARGSAPEGNYVAADFVRPDQYPGGAAAIGHCGALRLRGEEEDRMVLLHGDGGGFPADGAIQVGDEAMAAILNLIPAHPDQLERPVAIRVTASRGRGTDSDWEQQERWRRDDERWQRERQRERDRDSASGTTASIPEMRQDGFDNARAWGMAIGAGAGAVVAAQDAAAAAGLAKADVAMLPDGDGKPPALDRSGPAEAASAPKAPGDAPASDSWSASGGGYDR